MNDYPIVAGSALFTLVDPSKGHEVAYNRWYERDHFYAGCMIGPWLFAGKRWVATRAMKDLRFPEGDTPVASPHDKGSYLATYWVLEDKHKEHFDWAGNQVVDLYMNNRGFMERQHAHTVLLSNPEHAYRDDDPVPIELAFDHHYQGLAVVAVDPAEGVSDEELGAHLDETALPALLANSPIASMVYFCAASPMPSPWLTGPRISPPTTLMAVMTRPAMASPRTNLLAPSMAP